jgi:hypothetical protein
MTDNKASFEIVSSAVIRGTFSDEDWPFGRGIVVNTVEFDPPIECHGGESLDFSFTLSSENPNE